MIVIDCLQGSDAWRTARLGIPTASQFGRLITPKTRKPSASADGYLRDLVAEWLLGVPLDDATSQWMERGAEIEAEARSTYSLIRDLAVLQVGFCLRDDGKVGCSPDGLVGEDGGLEIKVPSAAIHTGYLLEPDSLADEYRCQVQGSLYVTGRAWWDLLSFNPVLPPVLVRCDPDKEFIAVLAEIVDNFVARLEAAKAKLAPKEDGDGD